MNVIKTKLGEMPPVLLGAQEGGQKNQVPGQPRLCTGIFLKKMDILSKNDLRGWRCGSAYKTGRIICFPGSRGVIGLETHIVGQADILYL